MVRGRVFRIAGRVLPAALVHDELESGRLLRVLDEFELTDGEIEIRLAYVSKTLIPTKVRAFIDHATSYFEDRTRSHGGPPGEEA